MSDNSLIVPTLLTTGSLHFAEVKSDSTIQDVINSLVAFDEVCSDVLGELELENAGWALQKIRQEESGRFWEEGELKAMGDGQIAFWVFSIATAYLKIQALFHPRLRLLHCYC